MFIVYIIYSAALSRYYIGFTTDLKSRLNQHQTGFYSDSFTAKSKDWKLTFKLECESKPQALAIEKHIKSMKSIKYIKNLTRHHEISEKLLNKYKDVGSSR